MVDIDAIETVSPLIHRDADCLCKVARGDIQADCAGCGRAVAVGLHMPMVAYGFYCNACCPGCRYLANESEARMMLENRARPDGAAMVLRNGGRMNVAATRPSLSRPVSLPRSAGRVAVSVWPMQSGRGGPIL